ncbi:hypothetical protein Dsin_014430 [Dipteronia sinensis]|uniref:RNase H type-1 domain-containing protein n=1 Tax=Dipteronia sinensis TaxID=43782 RepID=A0AAE0AMH9_9ROSI|nr:hypothetical protein Dsin_014430 [Dipteronia sinensis]
MPSTLLYNKWGNVNEFKLNCAAISDGRGTKIMIGAIIRDSMGEVMACCSQTVMANYPTKIATLVAIQKGLQFGTECGLIPDVVEVNEAEVVKWINNDLHRDSEVGSILLDIKKQIEGRKRMKFRQIAGSANKVAHVLANYSLNSMEDVFWMEEFPDCIGSLIQADRPR